MPDLKGRLTRIEAVELLPIFDGSAVQVLQAIFQHEIRNRLFPALKSGGKECHDRNSGMIDGMERALSLLGTLREDTENALKIKEF